MSLPRVRAVFEQGRFPRVSGDEPHALCVEVCEGMFSPREWG